MNNSYDPQSGFILSALRFFVHLKADEAEPLAQKAKAILNWQPVIALAARHRVLPFVTLALDKAGAFKDIPADIWTGMEKDLQQALLDNRAEVAEFRSKRDCLAQPFIVKSP